MDSKRVILGRKPELAAIAVAIAATPAILWSLLPAAPQPPPARRPEAPVMTGIRLPAGDSLAGVARTSARDAWPEAGPLDEGPARTTPQPDGEAAHHERFAAAWRSGEEARSRLERDSPRLFLEAGSTAEQVALLRVLREAGSPASDELVALALTELPDESDPHGGSVAALVVGWLARQQELRESERGILEQAVREGGEHLRVPTRGRALRTLVEQASDEQLPALALLVEQEPDSLVRAIGEQALRLRRGEEERSGDHDEQASVRSTTRYPGRPQRASFEATS